MRTTFAARSVFPPEKALFTETATFGFVKIQVFDDLIRVVRNIDRNVFLVS
jgi:hypothetical protein